MGKLIVVGSGIKSISHITLEAHTVITKADKLLYLVTEEFLEKWIISENENSESLEPLYFSCEKRIDSYQLITDYIISESEKYSVLCVVFYGHPSFFADSALAAVKALNDKGGVGIILPGISSADALYADLCIDPGSVGTSFFEATDFLIHNRQFDFNSHLVLFQIGMIGGASHEVSNENIVILVEHLLLFYPENHQVTLYEASVLPSLKPILDTLSLGSLSSAVFSKITTLYIPPFGKAKLNPVMLNKLGINLSDFTLS